MREDNRVTIARPYEIKRRTELQYQLAKIRIFYIIFCLAVTFAFTAHLEVQMITLILFAFVAILYGLIHYFRPAKISEEKRSPPAADLLDFIFLAVLIYFTGGIKSCFHIAYTLPICGSIIRFGFKAGLFGYLAALAITGFMFLIGKNGPSIPPVAYIITSTGASFFVIWMIVVLAEKEWKLRDEIYFSSITDYLTGLYNSGYLRARAKEEIERSRREGTNFAIAFLDLDNFKLVNDQHGHLTGDRILKETANVLAGNIRKSDVLARYGGDEFVLLMPKTGYEQAQTVIHRIQNAVNALTLAESVKISLSSGIAIFPEDGEDLDMLLTVADAAMYKRK